MSCFFTFFHVFDFFSCLDFFFVSFFSFVFVFFFFHVFDFFPSGLPEGVGPTCIFSIQGKTKISHPVQENEK